MIAPDLGAFRHASHQDLPALVALELAGFSEHAWSDAQILAALHHPQAVGLLWSRDGRAIGSALGWAGGGVSELQRIAVHPAWRRQGLGMHLLAGFLAACTAKGAEVLWLEARSDNTAAIRLYTQSGLRPTGRRTDYYADGIDAVLMECPLHPGPHAPVGAKISA